MKKVEEIPKLYHEYAQKYEKYNVNEEDLKRIEEVCIETYDPSIGLNLDMYIRINLYFEAISQLYNNMLKKTTNKTNKGGKIHSIIISSK